MRRLKQVPAFLIAILGMVVFISLGCDDSASTVKKPGADSHEGHDHDGHDHDAHGHDEGEHDHPAHGPNHGHIFKLDVGTYDGEWAKYKDNNVIRMFIIDAKGQKNVPVTVDSFIVRPKVGDDDITFELKAEDPDAEGLSATYMLEDHDLTIAIPLGVDIEIKSGDQTWKGEIKAHKPLDH